MFHAPFTHLCNTKTTPENVPGRRYAVLDELRGFALISMVLYHAVWDLVYLFGFDWGWYRTPAAYLWQQSICWTFILLSGFCFPLGRPSYKRGALVFLAGAVVSAVTILFMPGSRILFGVLTLIGSCMLLATLTAPLLKRCNTVAGFLISFLLFFFARHISQGYLGFGNWHFLEISQGWYGNYVTAYLGFPSKTFFSTDYYPLLPWLFLFLAGYFANGIFDRLDWLVHLRAGRLKPVAWVGRHSLIIYMLHQPLIYVLLSIFT